MTGPNIASQELLFTQLSARLKANIDGQAVLLRSSDSTNLKAVLKQVIRDATNQRHGPEEEEEVSNLADVRGVKFIAYPLISLTRKGTETSELRLGDTTRIRGGTWK